MSPLSRRLQVTMRLRESDHSAVSPKSHTYLERLSKRVSESFSRCFEVGNAICLGNQVITTRAPERGLVAFWTFDKLYPIDESGYGNHIVDHVTAGPPSTGHGSSAVFDEDTSCRVVGSPTIAVSEFTLNLRLYLLDSNSLGFRNIISRTRYAAQSPTVLLYPLSNKLSVRVSTEDSANEGLTSNAAIPLRRWTQLTVVAKGKTLKLYVNGMLDSAIALRGELVPGSGDLYLGRKFDTPGFSGYLDDVKLYNYALGPGLVAAFANPSLTGFGAPFRVQLASTRCTLQEANANGFCAPGCRLCTLDQLYRSAAHVARINGWLHDSNQIWHKGIPHAPPNDTRAAICCC
ncbi:concanavalin A-like lectin glucanase family protein, putative [Babesia ovata]|uniref:Concanavalin A-like lectin glucanase family protein, putative n=1 Tax=Babesia ovata TaxID=189622 RepID=A0A2H6K9S6_9APIC|nr:concanavalin A-like lectin glucanase family protein, putative [Babesia ovata]GBE59735.1 concanavalin A-like lectin glucanase family protein, putative [Babesia ovata]